MTSPTTPQQIAFALPGLRAEGEIRIDRWGVPHIRAGSLHDAFFLQGFNAARDRLFQIDLWRKRGLGLLAGDFGPGYLAQDRASRLFLYRGAMAAEYAHYGDDAEEICAAFAAGINAAIDAIEAGDLPLPEAFGRLGTSPAKWSPEDVVRIRIHALAGNAMSEFLRHRLMQVMGAEDGAIADQLRAPLLPHLAPREWKPATHVALPADAMDLYRLATAPVTFPPARLRATLDEAETWSKVSANRVVQAAAKYSGSNNWAVAASHTTTGRPLMASDPHRAFAAPSIRYLVHLEAPGLSVIGAGEPSSPGVMAGHNGHSAFSMTYFPADQEDLMVLDLVAGGYHHVDGPRPLTEITETIPVRGAPDQPVVLRFAGNAPILWQDDHHALALRTTFTEPGTAPYMACLASMRARSPDAFCQALEGWGAPASNQVYADVSGEVLWQVAGRVPRRKAGHGVLPVPGDGRADWAGFMNASDLPGINAPARGFVNSSNEMNLPPDWDSRAVPVGFEWYRDGRADRVTEVLSKAPTDVAASCALQTDAHNRIALRLIARLPAEGLGEGTGADAAKLLHGWDGVMHAQSGAALIYAIWSARHLYPALIARLPEAARPLIEEVEETAVVEIFEGGRPELAALLDLGDKAARQALLGKTFADAVEECVLDHGRDVGGWAWGDVHRARFVQPSGGPEIGPLPVGGGTATVMMQAYEAPSFQSVVGASVRMVVDVGAWDESRWINTPGQSGEAGSDHGGDLAPIWAAADYVPMPYSREAVDAVTTVILKLSPEA